MQGFGTWRRVFSQTWFFPVPRKDRAVSAPYHAWAYRVIVGISAFVRTCLFLGGFGDLGHQVWGGGEGGGGRATYQVLSCLYRPKP